MDLKNVKFAHIADLHIGSYREKFLTTLCKNVFVKTIDKIINEKVEFVIICGDIFDTAHPKIEFIEFFVEQIKRLKEIGIRVYFIGGSHDYDYSQKSFLNILEKLELFVDCSKYKKNEDNSVSLNLVKDEKTNILISGIYGKKNGLDKNIYKNLSTINNDEKDTFKIFMFHCSLNDFKPDFMNNVDIKINKSFLPLGFDYYAGGHIHINMKGLYNNKPISYSGVLFPNNFREFVRETPSFNICSFDENKNLKIEKNEINIYKKIHIKIDLDNLTPINSKEKILKSIKDLDLKNQIILLEIFGKIDGKIADIELNKILEEIYNQGANIVLKNTYKLKSNFLENNLELFENKKDISKEELIENLFSEESSKDLFKDLIKIDFSKKEKSNAEFENDIIKMFEKEMKKLEKKI